MKNRQSSFCLVVCLLALLVIGSGCTRQVRAKRHLSKAQSYFAANDYEKAEIEYINVLRLQSTNATALRGLGDIFYADELMQNAGAVYTSLKEVNPNDFESRAKLSRLMLLSGGLKDSRAEAEFVVQRSPTNEEAVLVLVDSSVKPEEINATRQRIAALKQQAGDKPLFRVANGFLALREKNIAAAEAEIRQAVALDTNSSLAHWALGNFYLIQRKPALAEPEIKTAGELAPIRSSRRLRYAAFRSQAGDFDGANAVVTNILSKAPDFIPAWVFSARMALDRKQFDKCATSLERVLRRSPTHFEAIGLRAEMNLAQNQPDKAIADYERLVTAYPRSIPARYQLAVAALAAKDVSRATAALSQALAIDKNYTPAILLLSEINLRKGDTSIAISTLSDLIKRDPTVYRAYILLGAAYLAGGKPNEALANYARAARAFPNSIEIALLLGDSLRQQGKLDDARKIFEGILKSRPDDPKSLSELTALDVAEKKFDQAVQRLQQWAQRAPTNAEPVFQLASLRYAQNDVTNAQALFEKVVAMNPGAIAAYNALASIYYNTHQVDSALQKCDLALKQNPSDASALFMSAMIYDQKKDHVRARDQYEKLLAVAPYHIVALNNIAVLYSEQFKDLEKAYAAARKAEELRPNDPYITDTLGWINSLRGDYSVALSLLGRSAQDKPAEPEIVAHLGITQYMLGNEAAARTTLERSLQLTNSFKGRDQVEKCIALLNINPATADQNAVAALEKRLAEQPDDAVALARLAAIYDKAGKSDKSAAIYEKAVGANPKLAIAVARLAEINDERLKNSAKAIELAKDARKLDASDARISHIAGRIATKSPELKDQQWGLTLLQESSQKQPEDPSVAYDLGWAYLTQGRLTDAETSLKSVLAAGPDLPSVAAAKRVLAFLPLLDPAKAAERQADIDQALRSDANYLPALAAQAAAAQQKGDTNAALKSLDQILTRYPGFGPALRSFAILSSTQTGDATKPLAAANRAKEIFPNDPLVDKALGILQYRRGEYQVAVRTLAEVARKRPDDENIQFYLGMSHYQLKQARESKVALKRAIELQPKAPFVADAQKILAELK